MTVHGQISSHAEPHTSPRNRPEGRPDVMKSANHFCCQHLLATVYDNPDHLIVLTCSENIVSPWNEHSSLHMKRNT